MFDGDKRFALLASATLFLAISVAAQDKSVQPGCAELTVRVSLKAGNGFSYVVSGDLKLSIKPLTSGGWAYSLDDAKGHDFIYPVNPPLRLNNSQTLGAGYGLTAKQSLRGRRQVRFILNESDYAALDPYVSDALWPYSTPDPDHAADRYLAQIERLRTGTLVIEVVRSDVRDDDDVRAVELEVRFIVPTTFPITDIPPAVCPSDSLPINERLTARIPAPDPGKYRDVQDASEWKNPYVTITTDGFDLRFRSGELKGPMAILARTLVTIPDSAWPYGRVVAVSESGVRSVGDSDTQQIKANREQAAEILSALGISVSWWPTA